MNTLPTTDTVRPVSERSALTRISDWVSSMATAIRRRRALYALADMDDAMLDDIGLTRGDVDWALNLPLTTNAALELQRHARNRRFGASGHRWQ